MADDGLAGQDGDLGPDQLKSAFFDEIFEVNTLLCYLGFTFLLTSHFFCLFGSLLYLDVVSSPVLDVLISVAFLGGMVAAFLIIGSKRGSELFLPLAKHRGCILLMTLMAMLLPISWIVSMNIVSVPYAVLVVVAALTGVAYAFFFVAWQMLCWSLSIWSFVRFLGIACACALALFLVIRISLIEEYQFALICTLAAASGAIFFTISGGKRSDYVIVREEVRRAFTFEKKVDVLYMLLHAVGGTAAVFLLALYGSWFICAIVIAVAFLLCLVLLTRNRRTFHGAFLLREMRIYIAVQVFSLILLMVPVDAVRIGALSVLVASWLTLEMFQGIFLERFLGFGPTSVYYICISGTNMNGSLMAGLAAGAVALVALPDAETIFLVFLVVASALILFDAQFLPYEADLDLNLEEDSEEDQESGPVMAARAGSVAQYISDRSEELIAAYQLSKREGEVLRILARGSSTKYIANTLGISEHTARVHVYHIYEKMGVHSRQALIDLFDEEY